MKIRNRETAEGKMFYAFPALVIVSRSGLTLGNLMMKKMEREVKSRKKRSIAKMARISSIAGNC